ncbi:MAG: bifunctional phosphoglucose/phosphomannose isomerase [Solirubrobacterales bacterium]|nr:bifunctional phosphoglucose/phosphomannose isomerase [Solirubrobacterales bacterium]
MSENALDPSGIAAVDKSGLLDDIIAIPDHISDAMWRAESAMLEPGSANSLVVCGMGGSAIGADLAAAVIGDSATKPIFSNRSYDLPSWVGEGDAVVLSTYSGSTEETLSCFEQARSSGAKLYVISSGGPISETAHAEGIPLIGLPGIFQPRAAVAYGVVAVIEIAIANGIAPVGIRKDLEAAAELMRGLTSEWGADSEESRPKQLAREAFGRLPIVYGAGLTDPVAYRWKCQINENAKRPAWNAALSEANHNEICGWEGAGESGQNAAWLLADSDQNERIAERIRITSEIASSHGARAEIIQSSGESRAERLFSLVLLGDLMSFYLAVLHGVDPTPVPLIENLKDQLGRPTTAG